MNYFLVIALLLCFISCTEEIDNPPQPPIDFSSCDSGIKWTEVSTRDSLLGIWELIHTASAYSGQNVEDKKITIEFRTDSSLAIRVMDSITQVSSWIVVQGDGDRYAVETDPFVEYLGGRIRFCDDWVLFNNSYIDLADIYFRRKP